MDSLVWGFTHLFPAAIKGLYAAKSVSSEGVGNTADKRKMTNLYADFYAKKTQSYGILPKATASGVGEDAAGGNMYSLY